MTGLNRLKSLKEQCEQMAALAGSLIEECEKTMASVPATAFMHEFKGSGRVTHISDHAIERYRQRTGCNKSDENVANKIGTAIAGGQPMELKPKYRALELLNHGIKSESYRANGMLFIVENGVCVTVHHGEAERWKPKV